MALHDDDTVRGGALDTVLTDLAKGKTSPCYLLCGEEEFLIQDALEKITMLLIPDAQDRGLNLFAMDGNTEDVDALCESLITPPLLPGHKVVIVKNTRLFHSRNVITPLIARIRERLDQDPPRAAAEFMQFLRLTGLQLDDLRDGGWRKLDDEEWRRVVPDDSGVERELWLPKAVELCLSLGALPAKEHPEETDRLERTLAGGMPEENHLILTAETVDRRKKLFKTIAAVGRIVLFAKAKSETRQQQTLQEMAAEPLARAGKRLSAGAWTALGQKTGFDLRESMGAIEKLITYAGEKAAIDAADVEAVVGRTKEDTVFALTGALAGRNLAAALRALQELLDGGEPPLRVFSMIVNEIRFLYQAKLLIASGRLGSISPEMDYGRFQKTIYPALRKLADDETTAIPLVSQHPFVVYQALKHTGRFTRADLLSYLDRLLQTDLALKSTGQNPRLLIERFLITACGAGKP